MSPVELSLLLSSVVKRWNPDARILDFYALTPDASLRRYYRLLLDGPGPHRAVAMVFDSVKSPEYDVGLAVPSDESYVELSYFFLARGVQVPELYFDAREQAVLLVEDLGSRHLIDVFSERDSGKREEESVEALYRQAIEQIALIQRSVDDGSFFAFKRAFSEKPYYLEMLEFRDYLLLPLGASPKCLARVEACFSKLSDELAAFPRVLAHRDFHSWNLLVDANEKVRVIDFQDALMATEAYDVVGLLHDRDTDGLLGGACYERLLSYAEEVLGQNGRFGQVFLKTAIQRDFKVSGRFRKLSKERGLLRYDTWVPGTLKRLSELLKRLSEEEAGGYAELYRLISELGLFERGRALI